LSVIYTDDDCHIVEFILQTVAESEVDEDSNTFPALCGTLKPESMGAMEGGVFIHEHFQ
jgi:hypothetical protein